MFEEAEKEAVECLIKDVGINKGSVLTLPFDERPRVVRKHLVSDQEMLNSARSRVQILAEDSLSKNVFGFIKPEMDGYENRVVSFLMNLGCEPKVHPKQYLTHQQWLDLYGYVLNECEDAIFLYLIQRSLGVQPIEFDITSLVHSGIDQIEGFNRKYCGSANNFSPGTIRWEVNRPVLLSRGFGGMTGYAQNFDPFDYYRNRGAGYILRAFNGIHLPNSYDENASNKKILFKS